MTAAVVSSLSASLGLDPASPYCALLEQVFHLTKPGAGLEVVLQKVPSEANPKVRNHGEGPYSGLLLVESGYYRFHI